jgi:predicted Zn-dependent peptidase
MLYTWVSCAPDDAADIFARLRAVQELAESSGFTADELHRAVSKLKARIVLGSERPRNRLFNVGGNWLQRREYRSVADDLAIVDGITLDDIHAVLAKYPLTRSSTVTIGPLAELSV